MAEKEKMLASITFEKDTLKDIDTIIEIRNKCFYSDFIKHGEYPGYNCSVEGVGNAISNRYVYMIKFNGNVVGNISVSGDKNDNFFLHSLCVIPEYQNKGIGQESMKFIENQFSQAKHWSLETPADKIRNHYFYKKFGYQITKEYMYNNSVELVLFEK